MKIVKGLSLLRFFILLNICHGLPGGPQLTANTRHDNLCMKHIDFRDILILLGFTSMGVGLFFWFGLGESMTICGVILVATAMFGK